VRVAINASFLGEQYNGIGTYVCGLIECLATIGCEVVVYSGSRHLRNRPEMQVERTSPRLAAGSGSAASAVRLAWSNILLPFRLRFDRIDLLISPGVDGSLWCPVPRVIVVHDLIPLYYPQEAPRLHIYYKKVLPQLLRRASVIIAVSQHTRNDLVREFDLAPERVVVVYNGLRPDLTDATGDRKPPGLEDERYFLFVGTFARRKNLHTVIQALAKVRHEIPESLVVVAYPDQWKPEILRSISEHRLSDKVLILSGLHNGEINYLYRHATALFLLSEYEGFGYPPLEAMLTGTPAVVSDSTSLAEVVGGAALKIGAHDTEAAAAAMLRLSRDQQYRCTLQQLGVEQARRYSWADAGSMLNRILSQLSSS
jgi:glycosyltransferase involved in cell wall biosynthesis